MASLLDIPELVRNKILGYLDSKPSQLLRLRRVCKTTKQWITEYPRQEITFSGIQVRIKQEGWDWEILEAFLEMNLKIRSIYVDNLNEQFFSDPLIQNFLEIHGPHIKKLKVATFHCCSTDFELNFYSALTSLEELEFQEILIQEDNATNNKRIPDVLTNLKVLKLGKVPKPYQRDYKYLWYLVNSCPNLEELWHPEIITDLPGVSDHKDFELGHIMDYIKRRAKQHKNKPNLKYFNMKNLHEDIEGHFNSEAFMKFIEICYKRQIKLLNVDAQLFDLLSPVEEIMNVFQESSKCILSLVNLQPAVGLLQLSNLEKINITSTYHSQLEEDWNLYDSWEKLKTLKINFDALSDSGYLRPLIQDVLGQPRPSVESLTLSWTWKEDGSGPVISDCGEVRGNMIIDNFTGLKKLKIVGWDAKNRKFLRLWNGLETLEEVWIENCPLLGNVGFIGENPAEPVFLKLTGLKKLTVKLHPNNKITDRCFRDVFRHLRLTEFNLICSSPLEKVTKEGIESLLDGVFAESIEKFSFKTWSLVNTTEEQMLDLKSKFKFI